MNVNDKKELKQLLDEVVTNRLDHGFKSLRGEMDEQFKSVRGEVDQGFKSFRKEIDQLITKRISDALVDFWEHVIFPNVAMKSDLEKVASDVKDIKHRVLDLEVDIKPQRKFPKINS